MGKATGNPRGRPRGTMGSRTVKREIAMKDAARIINQAIPGAFEGDSYAFLMSVWKDPAQEMEQRIKCAMTTIKYERPALASTELTGPDGGALIVEVIKFGQDTASE